ncbi:MAG: cation:dicarboxylate symporter family transporter, partial [Brevibacterium aurantiacum]
MPSTADPTATSTPPQSASRLGQILRNYRFPLLILTGVVIGAIIGLIFGEKATVIKPFGTLFINMMFTLVVPLVFFSISSAVAGMSSATRLGKILGSMLGIFAITGIIASIVMIAALWITKATEGVKVEM